MSALDTLIGDVECSVAHASNERRDRAVARIAELFATQAPRLREPQVELFDGMFGWFALKVTTPARARLAERLADLSNAPPKTVRLLAFDDDIMVARPVLARSRVLGDGDLIEVACLRGREHMVAISGRRRLSEAVTDILAADGDDAVRRAVARNAGAQLSPSAIAIMVERCREDDTLGELLGARADLSDEDADRVLGILKERARAHVLASLPPEETTDASDGPAEWEDARAAVAARAAAASLGEADLVEFASDGLHAETVCAVAAMTGLPIATVGRVFVQPENDLLLVLAKAHGWSWRTVRQLLRLRDPSLAARHHFRHAEEVFDGIAASTAQRVAQVLVQHGAAADGKGAGRGLQARRNVR